MQKIGHKIEYRESNKRATTICHQSNQGKLTKIWKQQQKLTTRNKKKT